MAFFQGFLEKKQSSEMSVFLRTKATPRLDFYGFPGDDTPFIKGSALKALKGEAGEYGADCVKELIGNCDSFIPDPKRPIDQPFLMSKFGYFIDSNEAN